MAAATSPPDHHTRKGIAAHRAVHLQFHAARAMSLKLLLKLAFFVSQGGTLQPKNPSVWCGFALRVHCGVDLRDFGRASAEGSISVPLGVVVLVLG